MQTSFPYTNDEFLLRNESKFTPTAGWDSTKNYECIHEMRDKFRGPILDLENHYEGAHDSFDLSRLIGTPRTSMYEPRSDLLRDSDWYPAQINQNTSGSWRKDIYFEGATQIQYATKPLQNLTTAVLETLEPAREILRSPNGHTGKSVNTYEGTRYISILASQSHDRYYVYTGHGDSFALELDNGSGARSGSSRWFSPRDGQYTANSTVDVPGSGNATAIDFTPPSTGGIDDDWVLVLEF
ncbi:hypothetical protein V7S43_010439 [Phytophthora oleae]|uniref:Putative collagen-binding domain-containing protein n=1 Tax=Phytophthora oleae TaxID=2107226 RepID=A0ABD3FGN3_9STRA